MATLEARELERNQVRVPRGELGRPHLVVGARRVAVLPDILDFERVSDRAGSHLVAEQAFEKIRIERQRALREHRISELLEFIEDLVIEPGIVMVGPREHDDPNALVALEVVERSACALPNV